MGTVSVQGNKVFCPLDHATMTYAKTVPHVDSQDMQGKPIKVTQKLYVCPKCESVVAFSFREDGKPGELKQVLDFEKQHGKLLKSEIELSE